jgi:hypothetical protein
VLHDDIESVVALGVGQAEHLAPETEAEGPNSVGDQKVHFPAEVVPADLVVLQDRGHEDRDDA